MHWLAFGDEYSSYRAVARWAQSSREGREEIKDATPSGRSVTQMADENSGQTPDTIDNGSHVTIEEFQENTNRSHGIIHKIISHYMSLKKIIAPYIPIWRLYDTTIKDESFFIQNNLLEKC